MPEESHRALKQDPMGEESPHLRSPLSNSELHQPSVDVALDCYNSRSEPSGSAGERPVSLSSTLSSGSSRDSRSLFGSTAALPSSSSTTNAVPATPPIPGEEDIDLELSPAEGSGAQDGVRSPALGVSVSRGLQWLEQQQQQQQQQQQEKDLGVCSQRNNNNASASSRRKGGGAAHPQSSPVATDAMAPNPKLSYVDRVVMEIIETERMYVRDLRSIVEDYLAQIIDTRNLPIRPEQVCALFGNIEDIYEFNSELLQSLDLCESDPVAVARCFVDKSEDFEIYTQYCTNYPNSVAALTDCMRSKTLGKFFRDRQASLKRSLPLGSFLLKPVQRILKYHLLLQEIARHYDPEEEGYEVVQEAIDTMTGVAWYINDMKRKHEHAVRLQEIQSLLINWKGPDLTTYGELVLEGTFHVQRAKNSRTLFLFDKMLLITKRRGEHYVYKTHISCSTLMLLDSAKDPLLFSVIHFKHPKQPHTVQAKSVEEKRLWAHHIKRLILENHNTLLPQTAKETILEMDSVYAGKYRYSPERLKKAESCQAEDFPVGGRNERRRSEPAKQIVRTTRAFLKHADSEGALLGERCSLRPASSVSTLASSLDEPQAEGDHGEDLSPGGDSAEQPGPREVDPKVGGSPGKGGMEQEKPPEEEVEEGEGYKEDILMGDDQVADFASSMLAAISCWHYRARALLSAHFTTDDPDIDAADPNKTLPDDDLEASTQEEEAPEMAGEEALPTQVIAEQRLSLNLQDVDNREPEDRQSQYPERPVSPSLPHGQHDAEATELVETSSTEKREEEEGESDSSGLQVEDTSLLTNSEFSEEEQEVVSDSLSTLSASVLENDGTVTEGFVGAVSSRVPEDLSSLACPITPLDSRASDSPSFCLELRENTPEPQPSQEAILPTPVHEPGWTPICEGERRSTLSKQDRLLIHKIRRYYEHAEDQDAGFSIKRRESLSYIPAGLVRHLSKQLNSVPQGQALPVQRKGSSQNRPTSWSVFDLPGVEKNARAEPHHRPELQKSSSSEVRAQSLSDASAGDEEFRPSSDMVKVWRDMEMGMNYDLQESLDVQLPGEDGPHSRLRRSESGQISSETAYVNTKEEAMMILGGSEVSSLSDESSMSTPTTPLSTKEWDSGGGSHLGSEIPKYCEKGRAARGPLPRIISLRSGIEEDQILQDMGKMKNKVFQLARQYSQRIKNNRPLIRQKIRDSKCMPAVQEEKVQSKDNGKHNLTAAFNTYDQVVIHELSPSEPAWTPGLGATSQAAPPCSLVTTTPTPNSPVQSETFHWPDVHKLSSNYAHPRLDPGPPRHTRVGRSCSVPERMLECCTERLGNLPWNPTADSSSGYPSLTTHMGSADSVETLSGTAQQRSSAGEDRPQPHPQLCRWSSLDTLPLHEVQNLQEPVRTCYIAGQATLPSEQKVIIVERVAGTLLVNEGRAGEQDWGTHHNEGSHCAKTSAALRSGKKTESKLVKNLREKFQSLSSGS